MELRILQYKSKYSLFFICYQLLWAILQVSTLLKSINAPEKKESIAKPNPQSPQLELYTHKLIPITTQKRYHMLRSPLTSTNMPNFEQIHATIYPMKLKTQKIAIHIMPRTNGPIKNANIINIIWNMAYFSLVFTMFITASIVFSLSDTNVADFMIMSSIKLIYFHNQFLALFMVR